MEETTNTNTSGGTRYSKGKPEMLWTPARGFLALFDAFVTFGHVLEKVPLMELLLEETTYVATAGPNKNNMAYIGIMLALLLRDDVGIGVNDWSLLRAWPAVGRVSQYGAQKYAPHDWYVGQDYSVLVNSMLRHINHILVTNHEAVDSESGLPSAAHALWNCLAYLTFHMEGRTDLDDITPYVNKTTPEVRGEQPEDDQEADEQDVDNVFLFPGTPSVQ